MYYIYLQIVEPSLEGLSIHGGLIVVISELNEVVHLVSKHSVMIGVVVGRITTQLIPFLTL